MNHYSLDHHLADIHQSFPPAAHQPVIGITANYTDGDAALRDRYYKSIIRAGGTPVIIPPVADRAVLVNTLDHLDGLLLSGGADYNPLWASEQPSPLLGGINSERDLPELLITRLAYNRQLPILGICRGIQTLAMALDGRVAQDISLLPLTAPSIKHSQNGARDELTHTVAIAPDSTLYNIYKGDEAESESVAQASQTAPHASQSAPLTLAVNSFHHQAVSDTGPRFRVTAQATDGVIEAIESTEHRPIIGVQWHPEWLDNGLPLFQWLVQQATNFSIAKQLHHRILTLDTHCDTPMFFAQGVNFASRDPHILVDLHKMTEGRQDAVTMVAYLPQPKIGETFSSKVIVNEHLLVNGNVNGTENDHGFNGFNRLTREDGNGKGTENDHGFNGFNGLARGNDNGSGNNPQSIAVNPQSYADLIFDKIEDIVRQNSRYLSIARTPADLYVDKRKGRKSIMLGIENGLALNHDLSNIRHFAQRGVVYITLCHNGDNDICDSARGCNTHNGVSPFGERVIEQMNLHGIMVDLSHAAEKSFYDALDISATPIVCSHSNCRALCNHPRNLTDDQMRQLARRGGVMHITLYAGFLVAQGQATIIHALDHLEHAIRIMGIDHVGLGTDFDGDGGIIGLADSSQMINFTLHLLRRKYSERDIEKIWGGNWLRVMSQVQNFPEKK